jgi:hypothetical protein
VPGEHRWHLADLTFVSLGDWIDGACMPEVPFQAMRPAVLITERGQQRALPRADVLWPSGDHAAIRVAALCLGQPLIPRHRRPGPWWQIGSARVDARSMAVLGRLFGVDDQ